MKKKFFVISGFVLVAVISFGFVELDQSFFKINQNIDIFGRVYKEIVANYVDEVDPEKFMRAGIDGMLNTLDPYTVYMVDKEGEEIDLITHGEYGGVGVSIGLRDGQVTVISPMEGYSAFKQGMKAGDIITEVDGIRVSGMKIDSVRMLVRGEPGSVVKMKVQREGEKNPLEFSLVREQIQIQNVSFADYVSPGIGYINVERFSRRAGEEVRMAIKELKAKGALNGIILDLRNNPGGLLEAAVDIVSKFAPSGSTVVTTRGRRTDEERTYTVNESPVAKDIPLVVLVNNGSASASEIVAGAMQDLDRGVILGTRSFGKGLVQTVVPLSSNASIKITTARYYTPSGRCIQEIDYLHKNKDGVFLTTPDSLRKDFSTKNGRLVKDQGGIMPDSVVEQNTQSEYFAELMRKAMFFKFATTYVSQHQTADSQFTATDGVLKEFEKYLSTQKFQYTDAVEKRVNEIHDEMKKGNYSSEAAAELTKFSNLITKEKSNALARHKDEVRAALEEEINGRYFGEKGRTRTELSYDKQVNTAVALLNNTKAYEQLLRLPLAKR
ncbi:MAG: S41 family peptidase [Bacteroidetes bacterium]|nr:S41 family peptidase [Bacteroidota bacterium]